MESIRFKNLEPICFNPLMIYIESSSWLKNNLNGLEENLGIYYEHIMFEIEKVLIILRKAIDGDDGVGYLVNTKLPKMIADMEMLIEAGLGDAEQKVLSLRRR